MLSSRPGPGIGAEEPALLVRNDARGWPEPPVCNMLVAAKGVLRSRRAVARWEGILRAVERIHEASLGGEGWMPALAAVAGVAGGDRAFLITQDPGAGRVEWVAGFDMSPQHLARLGSAVDAGALPVWAPALAPGKATPSSAMASDRDFARSAFYNEVIRPVGDFYGLAAAPVRDRGRNVYLAIGRRLGREDYDADDRAALDALLPHIATAMRVGWRIASGEQRAEALDTALEELETGMMLVDATAAVLFANVTAERLLAENRGLCTDSDGLCASDAAATRELRRRVRECAGVSIGAGAPSGGITLAGRPGAASLRVLVAPYRPGACATGAPFDRPAALVLVSDPERSLEDRKERLRCRFGLTPVEALVALEVTKARGRAATAERLGIREATLKTHLIHIFEKTGASRQAELVRLILEEG